MSAFSECFLFCFFFFVSVVFKWHYFSFFFFFFFWHSKFFVYWYLFVLVRTMLDLWTIFNLFGSQWISLCAKILHDLLTHNHLWIKLTCFLPIVISLYLYDFFFSWNCKVFWTINQSLPFLFLNKGFDRLSMLLVHLICYLMLELYHNNCLIM